MPGPKCSVEHRLAGDWTGRLFPWGLALRPLWFPPDLGSELRWRGPHHVAGPHPEVSQRLLLYPTEAHQPGSPVDTRAGARCWARHCL